MTPKFINITKEPLPLLYDRHTEGYGVPIYTHKFYGTRKLQVALERVRDDLGLIGWLPFIEAFLSGGTQVDKGGPDNAHRLGNAVDFDGVLLKENPLNPWTDNIPKTSMYSAVKPSVMHLTPKTKTRFACILSRHFPVVLGDYYDEKHEDHLHAALSKKYKLVWRGSKSQLGLINAVRAAWGIDFEYPRYNGSWLEFLYMMTFSPLEEKK